MRTFKGLKQSLSKFRPLWALIYVTILPVFMVHKLLINAWRSGPPRAWDGSGHYGIAQIYASSIFPDTFGWTFAHFGGMPFPNFYPPLFFWLVAAFSRLHLVSFLVSFKLFVLVPLLLIPAAIWFMAWSVSSKNNSVAFTAAFISLYPLLIARFGGQTLWASGLDYFSTLSIGMYTQPLGFILLLAWCAVYFRINGRAWRFVVASLLLAAAVLTNFLNGMLAALIIPFTLLSDLAQLRRGVEHSRGAFISHLMSPLVSIGLTLFWIVPMFNSYTYFVTRPFTAVIFTRDLMAWYSLAVLGAFCWFRRHTRAIVPYLVTCLTLALVLIFSAWAAPRWLPLQANRFSPILYFFCSVPIAFLVVTVLEKLKMLLLRASPRIGSFGDRYRAILFAVLLLIPVITLWTISRRPGLNLFYDYRSILAFYPASYGASNTPLIQAAPNPVSPTLPEVMRDRLPGDLESSELIELLAQEHQNDAAIIEAASQTINSILRFGRDHRDGRYLVEIPAQFRTDAASFDARSLNSYLGAQGNETLTVVYREASANSVFMYPQVSALSFNPDNFGFSSVLGDDIDFVQQPLARHLERVRMLGAKYLVITSDQMKDRLSVEPAIGGRQDFGKWSIFELRDSPPPMVRVLPYRPALLVSRFSVKARQANDRNYIRFAEEQFADGWFDVPLVCSQTTNLDRLGTMNDLDQFGALILDSYDCRQCDIVYRQLKDFANRKPLILLAQDIGLFNRIRYSIKEFPLATIIEKLSPNEAGPWLENFGASRHYEKSPVREDWKKIRAILEQHKVQTEPAMVSTSINGNSIELRYDGTAAPQLGVPVLISATYHPNWQSATGDKIYAASPMFMLTFVRKSTQLNFSRRWADQVGLWVSVFTMGGLILYWIWRSRWREKLTSRAFPNLFSPRL